MQNSKSYGRLVRAFTATLVLLTYTATVYGYDTYNPANHQLSIGSLTIGSATFLNMVVTVGRVVSLPSTSNTTYFYEDSYDPSNTELGIEYVTVGTTNYESPVVTISSVVSLGTVTGADGYANGQLSMPAVQVLGRSAYTDVVITVGRIISVGNGMPTVSENQFDPSTGQLTIPVVQYAGNFYTNVVVTPGRIVSVGGAQLIDAVVHSFSGGGGLSGSGDGGYPNGLVQGGDGNYYGTTSLGGTYNQGTVIKITPAGTETVLYSFSGNGGISNSKDGAQPYAGLIQGSDGNFYGTTYLGGEFGSGTVFRITTAGAESVLYSFSGTSCYASTTATADGANPDAGVIQASDGNYYGTTYCGGADQSGTVFKVTPAGAESVLYSFTGFNGVSGGDDGALPISLIQGSDGNFYGTTEFGGLYQTNGVVFKVTTAGVESVLYSFSGGGAVSGSFDGASPGEGPLVEGTDGDFYGTTTLGGTYSQGTVFKISSAGAEAVVYSFSGNDGLAGSTDAGIPYAGLILGSDGNFYGTTYFGGVYNRGAVFKVTSGGAESVLYSFCGDGALSGSSDGAYPYAGLLQANDGNFYGATNYGGTYNVGAVFQLTNVIPE